MCQIFIAIAGAKVILTVGATFLAVIKNDEAAAPMEIMSLFGSVGHLTMSSQPQSGRASTREPFSVIRLPSRWPTEKPSTIVSTVSSTMPSARPPGQPSLRLMPTYRPGWSLRARP